MKQYYLFSPEHEYVIDEIIKTNGEVIPKRIVKAEARALYMINGRSHLLRDSYPTPSNKSMKLYTVKTLKRILLIREMLHNYCGEWFDVYDENGKVALEEITKETK